MAFPTVESTNPSSGTGNTTGGAATSGSTAATSHAVVLPATVSAGALLLMFGRVAVAGAVSASGWTFTQDSSDASDDVTFWGYQTAAAAGTEDGTSVTVSHGSGKMVALTVSITGAENPGTQAPESSTVAVGTTSPANPAACTPTGGAKDYLWFVFAGGDGETPRPAAGTPPTNYGSSFLSDTGTGGAVGTNCAIGQCRRTNNAASEDPGTWALDPTLNAGWAAWTIAVHPTGGGAPPAAIPDIVMAPLTH